MHFGFNNQFIQAMRTRLIFQNPKKSFYPFLVFGVKNLYVKCIPDIKNIAFFTDIKTVRFYPIR